MGAPYTSQTPQVNKSAIKNNDLIEGSVIRFIRPWREDELPTERNFPVARIDAVRRTAGGFAIYQTAEGSVWFDRVQKVISEPAAAALAA